jgi:hypothetical protein
VPVNPQKIDWLQGCVLHAHHELIAMSRIIEKAARCVSAMRAAVVPPLQVVGSWIAQSSTWRVPSLQLEMYRPEAHYMRGPGPKHRAKWAQSPTCEL